MKSLLRSVFVADDGDNPELLLRNYQLLLGSHLGFEVPEYNAVWAYVQDFVRAHSHVPNLLTLKSHFEHGKEDAVLDQLKHLEGLKARTQGDFQRVLEDKANDRRQRLWSETLKEAAIITSTGMEVVDGKEKRILKGPVHSARYVVEKAHDIVAPTIGGRLSGEVTKDGEAVKEEYERVEADPLAGIGQFAFLDQMDKALGGAKRHELWIHAAFTGGMKCLKSARIFDTRAARYRTIDEIFESQDLPVVHALDEVTGQIVEAQADACAESGVRPLIKITSERGRSIRVTDNHPFYTSEGWKDASELRVGDWVGTPSHLPNNVVSRFTDAEVCLLGYLLGDGHMSGALGFTNANPEILAHFRECLHQYGYYEKPESIKQSSCGTHYSVYPKSGSGSQGIRISRAPGSQTHPWVSPLRVLLGHLGLWGCDAGTKHIPGELWAITDAQAWLLLSALWSTDGHVGVEIARGTRKARGKCWCGSKSHRLCLDIQAVLQRLGVPSTVTTIPRKYKGKPYTFWTVQVTTPDGITRFLTNTEIIGKEREAKAALAAGSLHDGDWVPAELLRGLPEGTRARSKSGGWLYARHLCKREKVQRDTFQRLAVASGDMDLIRSSNSDVRWERITSIESDGVEMTYDLSIPGLRNFVANGFLTHNSTFMLNWAYNQAVIFQHNALIFSLEMPYGQCRRILYAIHSMHPKFREVRLGMGIQQEPDADVGLPYTDIRDGKLHEWNANAKAFYFDYVIPDFNGVDVTGHPYLGCQYGKIHIEVADPDKDDFTMHDLRSMAEVIYSKDPFSMVFVDHCGLMSPRRHRSSTTENLNEVIRDLKKLALGFNRGMGMAVVGLFQISREGYKSALKAKEKTGKAGYNLTHLSYANEAERSADVVTSTWIDDDLKAQSRVQFNNLKSRDQAPFLPFIARVEWPCRRLISCFDAPLSPEENARMGAEIDKAGATLDED
jgi:intein/homing endonuclease